MLFNSKPGRVEDLEDVTGCAGGSPGSTVDLECTDAKEAEPAGSTAQTRLPGGRRAVGVVTVSVAILILLPFLELDPRYPDASKGLSVLLVTAMFWVSEVMPLSVSSLLPMALYPLFGIVKASSLAHYFFGGTSFLFIAGFFLGLAIERWNLHTRFVHIMLSKVGGRVEFYLAAFMLCTWLLSMWISNTATMLCVLPVVKSFQESIDSSAHSRFQSGMLLAVGYAATIGGLATPVGTPTNGIFMTLFQDFWPEQEEFSFATFCVVALPLSAALLVAAYLMACTAFVWAKREKVVIDAEAFLQRQRIGKVSFEEMVVLADLICLMILWFTASPIHRFPGWKRSLGLTELNSGSIGLLLTLPLFVLPCGRWLPCALKRCLGEDRCQSICKGQPNYILDWNSVKQDFSWEILFVFGGGSLIAHGTVASGLANLIAQSLETLGLSYFFFILLVLTVVAFVTEVVSNMSTLNIFGSIIATAAYHMGYDQVQLLLAVSFAASFAFMLPMAGGPNMVVYSSGIIPIGQMARFGFGMNVAAILLGSVYICYVLPALLTSTGTSYSGLAPPSVQS